MQPQRLSDPLPAGIEVFQLALELAAPLSATDWALLSGEECARALRFHKHDDKVRFVTTRAALRLLLGERLRYPPQLLRFGANAYGKPSLEAEVLSNPAIFFNVSHAGSFALIALSERAPVGVDIEHRDPHCDVTGLSLLVLSELERLLPGDRRVDFFECWTTKEAVLKALGFGIAEHLQQLSVLRSDSTKGACYDIRHEGMGWPRVHALRLDPPTGYAAALAWQPDSAGHAAQGTALCACNSRARTR